jgi:hypothetical protein
MPLPSLVPRDTVFFDLFNQAGQNALRAARLLADVLVSRMSSSYRRSSICPTSRASSSTGSRPKRAIDATETAAHILEGIVIKNA